MDVWQNLAAGFAQALTPMSLLWVFVGALTGTLVGILPGLGSAATIAILLPVAAALDPAQGIMMLAGIYYGSKYGGSTTAILLNLPGEDSSVITAIDGYEMAKQGRAGPALGIAAIGSFIAGTVGVVGVTFLSPLIAGVAITFGPPEYASLMTLGLSMIMLLSTGSTAKAIISGVVGFMLSTIGMDLFSGAARFTMGRYELLNGIDFIAVSIGLFAIAEVMVNLEASSDSRPFRAPPKRIWDLFPSRKDLRDSAPAIAQGTITGFSAGVLPGVGSTVASFLSYSLAKRFSRHPEEYGRGAIGGVAAPESANNAATSAGFVPMLTLGIPAGGSMAILLGALFMYGLEPGPRFFSAHPEVVWPIIASMYVGNVVLVILNMPMVPLFASLLRVPYRVLYPTIIVISLVGVYSVNNSVFDVQMCVIFGTLGYVMRKTGFPAPPLVLAFILGPMIEKALRQSLLISGGDMMIFLTRPWSAGFLTVLLLLIVVPLLMRKRSGPSFKEMVGEESD